MSENQPAKWVGGNKYRGRAQGRPQIEVIPTTKNKCVEVVIECTAGDMATRRIKYTGWLNSESNMRRTVGELRLMGWTGRGFGDWTGIGTKEISFTAMSESKDTEDPKTGQIRSSTFWRAAFITKVLELEARNAANAADVDSLNAMLDKIGVDDLQDPMSDASEPEGDYDASFDPHGPPPASSPPRATA